MTKSLKYERLIALTEDEIKRDYPHGAVMKSQRWLPAERPERERLGYRTLAQLVAERKTKVAPDRYPHKKSQLGYTEEPALALAGIGAAPPKDWSDHESKERGELFRLTHHEQVARVELRSRMGRVRELAIQHIRSGMEAADAWQAASLQVMREDHDSKAA